MSMPEYKAKGIIDMIRFIDDPPGPEHDDDYIDGRVAAGDLDMETIRRARLLLRTYDGETGLKSGLMGESMPIPLHYFKDPFQVGYQLGQKIAEMIENRTVRS
jgi:hypothetical protein